MKIRTILLAVVAAMTVLIAAATGLDTYRALGERREAASFLAVNEVSELLIQTAGQWAIERAVTNTPLNASGAAESAQLDQIRKQRDAGDQPFRTALQRARTLPNMGAAQDAIAAAERAFQNFATMRNQVDAALAKPGEARDRAVVTGFAPAITALIGQAQTLRLTLETLSNPPQPTLAKLTLYRHLAAEMAENAGRERAAFGGRIAAMQPVTIDVARDVARSRGHVVLAWDAIRALRQRADTAPTVKEAIAQVEEEYFRRYEALREQIYAGGEKAAYPVTATTYVQSATAAINTILKLAEAIGGAARVATDTEMSRAGTAAARNITMMVGGLLLATLSFWVVSRRVVGPITTMTAAMGRLAGGDKQTEIAGGNRRDEIGDMAKAVLVFRENMIENDRLVAAQEAQKEQAARERKEAMHRLADDFERNVGSAVQIVASAATEMRAAAQSLSATAEESASQAGTVAAAATQATANVQTVASATEELSSSVAEIGRQVAQSTTIATRAAEEAQMTDATVDGLSKAAQKIGDVVALINNIASQTNLLALNATIEAARAGEAGKGFAVVASEVKALASQTSRATDEIRGLIEAIQSTSTDAVGAIRRISGTIDEINGIAATIAAAVDQQGAATREIARNVQEAAHGTGEVSSNILSVTQASGEVGSAATQVLGSAQDMSVQAERLASDIQTFLHTVRAA